MSVEIDPVTGEAISRSFVTIEDDLIDAIIDTGLLGGDEARSCARAILPIIERARVEERASSLAASRFNRLSQYAKESLMDEVATYCGTPLAQMTKLQLIGAVKELARQLDRERALANQELAYLRGGRGNLILSRYGV